MHIDGVTNARQISLKAEIDMEMVRACLRVLKHHGLIALVDMFFFSNRYEATSKAAAMIAGKQSKLLNDAVDFVIKQKKTPGAQQERESPPSPLQPSSPDIGRSPPSLEQFSSSYLEHREAHQMGGLKMASLSSNYSHEMPAVSHRREEYAETKAALAELYCACNRSSSVGEVWIGLVSGRPLSGTSTSTNWKKIFNLIDHRRFTLFGLVHGLLRRVHNFPLILDQPFTSDSHSSRSLLKTQELGTRRRHERSRSGVRGERDLEEKRQIALRVASMMDGRHCDDELVCIFQRPLEDLLELVAGKRVVHVYA
jgi:hypothetical protein